MTIFELYINSTIQLLAVRCGHPKVSRAGYLHVYQRAHYVQVTANDELVCVLGGGVWEVELVREMNNYISTKNLAR